MLSGAIKILSFISKIHKGEQFHLFYYKNNDNSYYICVENFDLYSSEKFLKNKKIAKKLIKNSDTKVVFCHIGDFNKFKSNEKITGKKIFSITKQLT